MNSSPYIARKSSQNKGDPFQADFISRYVWLYYRFGVNLRDVSELMLARWIEL